MFLNNTPVTATRKNCQFNVNIILPKQWQYRINDDGFTAVGYVWLPDANRRLTIQADYYWPNDGYVSLTKSSFSI